MKQLNVLLAAALLATTAYAQSEAPAPSVPATVTTVPAAAAPSVTVKGGKVTVTNPFTGTAVSVEELQAELEAARLRTAALEEQLKQTSLSNEITTVPLRKAVEAAQARTTARNEELKLQEAERANREAAERAARERADAAAAAKAAKEAAKNRGRAPSTSAAADAANALPAPAPMPRVTLLSVMAIGDSKSVVLDFDGATAVVEDGGLTPMGKVTILDPHSAMLGQRTFKVSTATLSRYKRSEQDAAAAAPAGTSVTTVPAPAQPGVTGGVTAVAPRAAAGGMPVAASTQQGAPGAPAQLPPLQLPPGMTILPASTR